MNTPKGQVPEALTGDKLREIVRSARTSASDSASPEEYALAGWCAAQLAAPAAAQEVAPIDMVLHCPKCGTQHIDEDNHEELRIEAAELGVDREGERRLERWIEEREWSNPPHRSHLCQNRKCGHIWRPADVPTNGVAAIKTAGTKDGPITSPSVEFQILKAEYDNLKSSYDRLKLAYDAWHEKTAWIHKTIKPAELGQHIADVMTARLQRLGDAPRW